ncbi:DUF397 domain-containing protein [Streptomyces sp. NPDC001492]
MSSCKCKALDGNPTGVPVRGSKAPQSLALIFPSTGWTSFVSAVKDGTLAA